MKNKQLMVHLIFAVFVCVATSVNAQDKSTSGCDNLDAFTEIPNVDYATQIQPIWDQQCGSCHLNGGHKAGLRLDRNQ
ncbi:MAG: hypothetical protein ACWA5R_02350 [bacterium]